MKSLFLAPHNDDETLFGAFTLLREKPTVVVVTDSFVQYLRGDNITFEQRRRETLEAMKVLGCKVVFGQIPDHKIDKDILVEAFEPLKSVEKIYAPKPYENGNPQHNLIGEVAKEVFGDKVIFYSTYTKDNLYMTGDIEVKPTEEELELKNKALQCYKSQLSLPSTRPHFEAVLGKSEWLYA